MNRREFLAASAAVAATPVLSQPKDKAMLPIVDTHQHLWNLDEFKLAWFDPKTPEGKILGHNFTPKEYAEATKGLNVVKAVYMEVDVVPEQQQKEADYIVELCESKKTPTSAAVVSGRPNSEGFEKYAKQFKGHKYVKGIRQVLHVKDTPAGYCLDEKFVKGIKLLGDLGLSFDLCVRPAELPDCAKLVDQCPDTRFILDHCGNANLKHTQAERDRWKKDMAVVAKRKNLVG
jgi:predicted TIM-barrel fold metal-dependent hydrolase